MYKDKYAAISIKDIEMKKVLLQGLNSGRMIAKNLILLFTLAVVCFTGMFSWYSNTKKATADGISVTCESPDGIEIAIVGHGEPAPASEEYKSEINLADTGLTDDLALTEITSDGITFMKPMLIQSSANAYPDLEAQWDVATPQLHYLSFDMYIRSKGTMDLALSTDSKFSTVSSILTGTNSGNKSDYGDFSKDCVVGAARFSVLSGDDNPQRKLLWIPRPDIQLNSTNGFSVNTGSTTDDSKKHYYYVYNNGAYVKTEMSSSNVTSSTANSSGQYDLPNDVPIVSLEGSKNSEGYYVNHVVCNMWIDGDDSEARLALVGGQFTVNLKLCIA